MSKTPTLTAQRRVCLTPELDARLERIAVSAGIPVATVIRLLVRQSLTIGLHHTITDPEYYRDSESIMKFLETNK